MGSLSCLIGGFAFGIPFSLDMAASGTLDLEFTHMLRMLAFIPVLLIIAVALYSLSFHHSYIREVHKALATRKDDSSLLRESDIASLPLPVQRYIRLSGAIGKPKVHAFRITFTGRIRKNERSEWMPFESEQYNTLDIPNRLFFMRATMKGLPVSGYHRFANSQASMDIRLLSLIRVEHQRGAVMDTAETVTFFNDMCCMAPATLIDKRIDWRQLDSNSLLATFTANGIRISATLYFNERGELVNFISNDRYMLADDHKMIQAPWSTPLKSYAEYHGHHLASTADAVYSLPTGQLCYGEFVTTDIVYNPESPKGLPYDPSHFS